MCKADEILLTIYFSSWNMIVLIMMAAVSNQGMVYYPIREKIIKLTDSADNTVMKGKGKEFIKNMGYSAWKFSEKY